MLDFKKIVNKISDTLKSVDADIAQFQKNIPDPAMTDDVLLLANALRDSVEIQRFALRQFNEFKPALSESMQLAMQGKLASVPLPSDLPPSPPPTPGVSRRLQA